MSPRDAEVYFHLAYFEARRSRAARAHSQTTSDGIAFNKHFDGDGMVVQRGFRKAANIQRCLDAELTFYAIEVFKIGLTF